MHCNAHCKTTTIISAQLYCSALHTVQCTALPLISSLQSTENFSEMHCTLHNHQYQPNTNPQYWGALKYKALHTVHSHQYHLQYTVMHCTRVEYNALTALPPISSLHHIGQIPHLTWKQVGRGKCGPYYHAPTSLQHLYCIIPLFSSSSYSSSSSWSSSSSAWCIFSCVWLSWR